jgi:hypothetical protein
MQCPQCGADLESTTCPACGADNLPTALFCSQCGEGLPTEPAPDLADRILCPDGACIGILNEQGECSRCGFAYKNVVAAEESHG